ncbi:LysR family transcriptional regulator [Bifidobacterium sp. LC6]|uniref:LysR family transcriptional regulator n=1 Tax=Bifidobacterium colobi TaxID=2809026 RepID=A0ABS5UVI3_9BIFI|nr:LysR family transcriptional regulator [Bifidobacterium colobi]MBT1174676.1 LysR family transcriptional regulator [Bifidobacterium colobi]
MYDKRLDAVIAAAETGSFASAGRLLHISTPALAKQVNTFEKEYRLTLFTRSRSGVTLTPAGRTFVDEARPIMRQCRSLIYRTQQNSSERDAPVRLGISLLRPGRSILDLWQRDASKHPGIRLELVSMPDDTQSINDILMHLGENIDMVSTAFDEEYWSTVCNTLTLGFEPSWIAIPRSHALAKRTHVSLDDLEGTRIRILKQHHGGNDTAYDLLASHPSIELIDIDHYDLDTFNDCADHGDLLMSKPIWSDVHPQFATIPVDWPQPIGMSYGLMYARDPSPAVAAFIARIRELATM